MKYGTDRSLENLRLARRLGGCSTGMSLGVLQSWEEFVNRYAPTGDLKRFSLNDLQELIDFHEIPMQVQFDALFECGFLQELPNGALFWKDWHLNAHWSTTHRFLYRRGEFFANGVKPKCMGVTADEKRAAEAIYEAKARHLAQNIENHDLAAVMERGADNFTPNIFAAVGERDEAELQRIQEDLVRRKGE